MLGCEICKFVELAKGGSVINGVSVCVPIAFCKVAILLLSFSPNDKY